MRFLTEILKLKDIWNFLKKKLQFTYFRENYGSQIDRIYATDFKENFTDIWVQPVSFSDHSAVFTTIKVDRDFEVGKSYWKLNVSLLEIENIEEDFEELWGYITKFKHKYENVNQWWELCGKVNIQKFFKQKGKEQSMFKQGLIKYLEIKLHRKYKEMHTTGTLDMNEVKRLKEKINNIKDQILEGVKIRARIKEQIEGEKASSTLLGKQSANKQKPLITQINVEETLGIHKSGKILNNQQDISTYITNYHRKMYSKPL